MRDFFIGLVPLIVFIFVSRVLYSLASLLGGVLDQAGALPDPLLGLVIMILSFVAAIASLYLSFRAWFHLVSRAAKADTQEG